MPTLRQVNRMFLRASLLWALVCGLLFFVRAAAEVVDIPLGMSSGEAATAVLVLGFFGNLWLSASFSVTSSLPSSKPVPLKSAPYLLPLWQIGAAATAASSFEAYRRLPGSQIPRFASVAVAGYGAYFVLRSIRSRVTDPSAGHWANLIACVEFVIGATLVSLAALRIGPGVIGELGVVLIALGWGSHAALVLFLQAFDLEPYDDQRPAYVALGAGLVMVVVLFLGPGGAILLSFAEIAYVLALAFLLQRRWFGRFLTWEERFLMVGVVAGFLGFTGALMPFEGYFSVLGLTEGFGGAPAPVLASGVVVLPLSFGAAYVAKERSRSLRAGLCKAVVAAVIAAALPQFLMSLFYFDPYYRYDVFLVRVLFGMAEIVLAGGLLAIATLAKGIARPRADLRPV